MGFIYIDVEVANSAAPDVKESVRMLVNTRAMLSVLPSEVLDRLGVLRRPGRRFRGPCGVVTRDTVTIIIGYGHCLAGVTAVFGIENDTTTMGVTALGYLGFEVDPVGEKLNRVEMLLL